MLASLADSPQLSRNKESLTPHATNMSEMIPVLVLIALMSLGSWFVVFRKDFRRKVLRSRPKFRASNPEQQEMYDAAYLAAALVGALAFTIMFAAALIATIGRDV